MILDELTTRDVPGVAEPMDPDAGLRPQCPCFGCGRSVRGAMPGWHLRKGPAPVLSERMFAQETGRRWSFLDQGDHGDSRELFIPSWVDHPYRLRQADRTWIYVAEPYDLGGSAVDDFAHLRANGFKVTVAAWRARHFPGHTVAVLIAHHPGGAAPTGGHGPQPKEQQ